MYETFFPWYYQGQRDKNFIFYILFKKLKTNSTARITCSEKLITRIFKMSMKNEFLGQQQELRKI